IRDNNFESHARNVERNSDGFSFSRSSGGPGISKDHFQSPRYLTRSDPGVVIQGFRIKSGQRSARGSSSPRARLDVIVPGLFSWRLFFPKRIESMSFLVCARVNRSGIILATESCMDEPGSRASSRAWPLLYVRRRTSSLMASGSRKRDRDWVI